MTFNEIEKKFDNAFASNYLIADEKIIDHMHDRVKSFLKQSFIKYLQSEVERLGFAKQEEEIYVECPHAFDCGGCMNKIEKEAVVYNQAISDQITHLQAQIKELEK